MHIEPIGKVVNNIFFKEKGFSWDGTVSRIILDSKYGEALDGIEGYSHVVVLFWLDGAMRDGPLKTKVPYGPDDLAPQGVFATRIPDRPNPIGVSVVECTYRNHNTLHVVGLDAFHGTPVLDIKPYTGYKREFILNFKVPEWGEYLVEEGKRATE